MKDKIPFFDYPQLYQSEREKFLEIFDSVAARGAFILQKELEEFECELAAFAKCKFALGVANATDALQLLLLAAGIERGDEVIFSSHTMTATAAAIHFAGAIPVPVECSDDRLISLKHIEKSISSRTTAIIPTQLNGRTVNMEALLEIAQRYGLQVIEDAAQSLGSTYKGQSAGTFDVGGAISFYPAKTLGCFGDGGAILTNREDIYEKVLQLHDHGRGKSGEVMGWGLNSRLDNLQAAFLRHKLKSYQFVIERRRAIAERYQEYLCSIPQLSLPPSPDSSLDHFDVYQNYEVEAENRDELREYLHGRGVGTIVQWGGKAVHQFDCLGLAKNLPYTEQFFEKCLLLPIYPQLTEDQIDYVCESIRSFYL